MARIKQKIGILGCGNMGAAIAKGIIAEGVISRRGIFFFDKDKRRVSIIKKTIGINSVNSVKELLMRCGILVLAVKPQQLADISGQLREGISRRHLIISLLAGVSIGNLRSRLKAGQNIVRVMPNLGLIAGEGITAITGGNAKGRLVAEAIFSSCGKTVYLPEKHFNLVTAVSGSGPAYFFYLMELLERFATGKGLAQKAARLLSVQTALGAALLATKIGGEPSALRSRVTSKGGTTEAAFTVLGSKPFRLMFHRALATALRRADRLGKG